MYQFSSLFSGCFVILLLLCSSLVVFVIYLLLCLISFSSFFVHLCFFFVVTSNIKHNSLFLGDTNLLLITYKNITLLLLPPHFMLLMSHITYFYRVYLLTNYYSYSYFNTIIFKLLYYS